MKIAWKPLPKQSIALVRKEDEILYGGARGGGKTDCAMAWLLYDIGNPKYRALVIRRNADDLKDWIDRARMFYAPCSAEGVGNPAEFRFPSGAIIRTGHLKDSDAYTKYQGHEYQKIVIEELTHISNENDYEKLLGSCRSTVEGIKPQVFCTTNPDGPGYRWVKARWEIPDNPTEIISLTDGETTRTKAFIPSTLQDNPVLMESDPGYIKYLESIQDTDLRDAWLYGSWKGISVEGAYYKTQLEQARKEQRITTVPFQSDFKVHTWWDLGVGDSTTIGFFQQANKEWHLIDCYEAAGEGLEHYFKLLQSKPYVYGDHWAPHDIEVRELGSGLSRLEMARKLGVSFKIAPKLSIEDGINALRQRFNTLWIDEKKCGKLLEALGQYRKEWNDKMGEWKNQPLHDWTSHFADMLRYWAVTKISSQSAPTFVPKHHVYSKY